MSITSTVTKPSYGLGLCSPTSKPPGPSRSSRPMGESVFSNASFQPTAVGLIPSQSRDDAIIVDMPPLSAFRLCFLPTAHPTHLFVWARHPPTRRSLSRLKSRLHHCLSSMKCVLLLLCTDRCVIVSLLRN